MIVFPSLGCFVFFSSLPLPPLFHLLNCFYLSPWDFLTSLILSPIFLQGVGRSEQAITVFLVTG